MSRKYNHFQRSTNKIKSSFEEICNLFSHVQCNWEKNRRKMVSLRTSLFFSQMMHRQQDAQSSSSNEFAMYPSAVYHSSCSTPLSSTSSSSSRSSSTTCPFLLSVLTWSLTFLLISSCIGLGADARRPGATGLLNAHPLGKRAFFELQCKGVYDKSIFARLDRICEDCYNLFREPQLHTLCKYVWLNTIMFPWDVWCLADGIRTCYRCYVTIWSTSQ